MSGTVRLALLALLACALGALGRWGSGGQRGGGDAGARSASGPAAEAAAAKQTPVTAAVASPGPALGLVRTREGGRRLWVDREAAGRMNGRTVTHVNVPAGSHFVILEQSDGGYFIDKFDFGKDAETFVQERCAGNAFSRAEACSLVALSEAAAREVVKQERLARDSAAVNQGALPLASPLFETLVAEHAKGNRLLKGARQTPYFDTRPRPNFVPEGK